MSYLDQDSVYSFLNSMIEVSKYCSEVMKKHFSKNLVMIKEDDEDFEDSAKCWICDNVYGDVKVRYHCLIIGKYRDSVHRDCSINVKLNHKIPIVFHSLKNYDSLFIMQELGKFNVKVNILPNGLKNI